MTDYCFRTCIKITTSILLQRSSSCHGKPVKTCFQNTKFEYISLIKRIVLRQPREYIASSTVTSETLVRYALVSSELRQQLKTNTKAKEKRKNTCPGIPTNTNPISCDTIYQSCKWHRLSGKRKFLHELLTWNEVQQHKAEAVIQTLKREIGTEFLFNVQKGPQSELGLSAIINTTAEQVTCGVDKVARRRGRGLVRVFDEAPAGSESQRVTATVRVNPHVIVGLGRRKFLISRQKWMTNERIENYVLVAPRPRLRNRIT